MRVLTGFKPTGTLHLGNYIGAIKPLLELAQNPQAEVLCLIADMHALNTSLTPAEIRQYESELIRTLMAFDPGEKLTFYRSSRIAEIGHLAQLCGNYLGKGFLNRSHAYVARVAENEELDRPKDYGINVGLYQYPLLMAADILAVQADLVPVGKDQAQHLEIAQQTYTSLAARLGKKNISSLHKPKGLIQHAESLPGLDGRKMSKSYDNIIPLLGPGRDKAVGRIATDSVPVGSAKNPDECAVMNIYRLFADETDYAALADDYRAGAFSYAVSKSALKDMLHRFLDPVQARYDALDENEINTRLQAGEAKVRAVAQQVVENIITASGM